MDDEKYSKYSREISHIMQHISRVIEMVKADSNCSDVLIELSKAKSVLNGIGEEMLQNHAASILNEMLEKREPVKLEDLQYLINTFVK